MSSTSIIILKRWQSTSARKTFTLSAITACRSRLDQNRTRTRPSGGSTVLPQTVRRRRTCSGKMFESIAGDANGAILPGAGRMAKVKSSLTLAAMWMMKLFAINASRTHHAGLQRVRHRMAIHRTTRHGVSSISRIIINKENILRMMKMVDDPHNGVTFCSGSYGTNLRTICRI